MIDSRGGSEPRAAERSLPSMPVRVTRAELERWKAAAAAQGLTLSAWVRAALDMHAATNRIESSAQSEGYSPISDLIAEPETAPPPAVAGCGCDACSWWRAVLAAQRDARSGADVAAGASLNASLRGEETARHELSRLRAQRDTLPAPPDDE